jgi:predicted nucleic acid-binding protein
MQRVLGGLHAGPPVEERSRICRKAFHYIGVVHLLQAQPVLPPLIPASFPVPRVVLDTNIALDWLLFGDASCRWLASAIGAGEIEWWASPSMRQELEHVLGRGLAATRGIGGALVLQDWDRWAQVRDAGVAPLQRGLRCTDPDDQKFIDFAVAAGADALLSRDRAVLKLARRAARSGLEIATVAAWEAKKRRPEGRP